jgi:hypothetical protein
MSSASHFTCKSNLGALYVAKRPAENAGLFVSVCFAYDAALQAHGSIVLGNLL